MLTRALLYLLILGMVVIAVLCFVIGGVVWVVRGEGI